MALNWKDMIGGCFGSADKIFAGHPSDRERAIDLLQECDKNAVTLATLSQEVENYLKNSLDFNSKDAKTQQHMQKHINKQLNNIKEKFEHWLD